MLIRGFPASNLIPFLMASCDVEPGVDEMALKAWCDELVDRWAPAQSGLLSRLLPLILQAYYEDYRVQQIYQRRPGPPFPEGYEVTQGDWSLLDKVRDRPPVYREDLR